MTQNSSTSFKILDLLLSKAKGLSAEELEIKENRDISKDLRAFKEENSYADNKDFKNDYDNCLEYYKAIKFIEWDKQKGTENKPIIYFSLDFINYISTLKA